MSSTFDLVVRGGEVVTSSGRGDADIGISGGVIRQLGGVMTAEQELDARGCFVLPGGIDMHVHLTPSPPAAGTFVDTFESGSRAAAAGGVTTFGHMAFPDAAQPDDTLRGAVRRDFEAAKAESLVDFVIHPSVYLAPVDLLDALPELHQQGHNCLKVVTLAFDHDGKLLMDAIALAGRLGMLTLVHCEDGLIIDHLTDGLVASGSSAIRHYPRSRPDYTESVAVERAVAICEATQAPMCLMHLSSRSALDAASRARARGLPIFVETRPLYLHETDEVYQRDQAGRYVGMPPNRTAADRDALWRGLADGRIHTIASDHAPWLLSDKIDPALDVKSCLKGMAELETMIPMLFHSCRTEGRLSLERLVALTATNAAQLYGLSARKGTIAPGKDADLIVLDPSLTRMIDSRDMQSRSDYCIYDGQTVSGWPRFTLSRGRVVVDHGQVVASPGSGQVVATNPIRLT